MFKFKTSDFERSGLDATLQTWMMTTIIGFTRGFKIVFPLCFISLEALSWVMQGGVSHQVTQRRDCCESECKSACKENGICGSFEFTWMCLTWVFKKKQVCMRTIRDTSTAAFLVIQTQHNNHTYLWWVSTWASHHAMRFIVGGLSDFTWKFFTGGIKKTGMHVGCMRMNQDLCTTTFSEMRAPHKNYRGSVSCMAWMCDARTSFTVRDQASRNSTTNCINTPS